jgi:predicted  nucleic acid-binding Zn-ribbon protein
MDTDATKAPRTHAAWEEAMKDAVDSAEPLRFMLNHSCKLERELNTLTSNEAYKLEKELEKANNRISKLNDYIALLETAGDKMAEELGYGYDVDMWNQAKEAKP